MNKVTFYITFVIFFFNIHSNINGCFVYLFSYIHVSMYVSGNNLKVFLPMSHHQKKNTLTNTDLQPEDGRESGKMKRGNMPETTF